MFNAGEKKNLGATNFGFSEINTGVGINTESEIHTHTHGGGSTMPLFCRPEN